MGAYSLMSSQTDVKITKTNKHLKLQPNLGKTIAPYIALVLQLTLDPNQKIILLSVNRLLYDKCAFISVYVSFIHR